MSQRDPFAEINFSSNDKPKPIKEAITQIATNALQSTPPKVPDEVLLQRQTLQLQQEIDERYLTPKDTVTLSEEDDQLTSNPGGKDRFKKSSSKSSERKAGRKKHSQEPIE